MTNRKKPKAECRLKSWADVDSTMKQVAECERVMSHLTNSMNTEIDEIKKNYTKLAKPVQERIDHYSADICKYVTDNRGEMDCKTKELNFGRTGFRISTKLKYSKGVKAADVVAALLQRGLGECVKTTQTIIADMLKKQPADLLSQVGAYLVVHRCQTIGILRRLLASPCVVVLALRQQGRVLRLGEHKHPCNSPHCLTAVDY